MQHRIMGSVWGCLPPIIVCSQTYRDPFDGAPMHVLVTPRRTEKEPPTRLPSAYYTYLVVVGDTRYHTP